MLHHLKIQFIVINTMPFWRTHFTVDSCKSFSLASSELQDDPQSTTTSLLKSLNIYCLSINYRYIAPEIHKSHEKKFDRISSGGRCACRYGCACHYDSVSNDRRTSPEFGPVQHLCRPIHLVWICFINRFFYRVVQSIQITRIYPTKQVVLNRLR